MPSAPLSPTIGGTHWGSPQTFFYPYRGTQHHGGEFRYVPDLEPLGRPGDYLTDKLTDRALDLIDQLAGRQPFYLNLWSYAVHTPIEGKPADLARYAARITPTHRHRNPHYAAMIHALDWCIATHRDGLRSAQTPCGRTFAPSPAQATATLAPRSVRLPSVAARGEGQGEGRGQP